MTSEDFSAQVIYGVFLRCFVYDILLYKVREECSSYFSEQQSIHKDFILGSIHKL